MRTSILFLIPFVLAASCSDKPAGSTTPTENPAPTAAPASAPVATPGTEPAPDYTRVNGRWARTDGDYVLAIKEAKAEGAVSAGYFNPNPINVSKAEVRGAAGKINVFVELRDANYPGCTYTLTYHPERDLLAGVYFQAQLQEQYEVAFERIKE